MNVRMMVRPMAVTLMMFAAGTASAVGDLPVKLGKRQAASAYAQVRPLLTNDGVACPRGQTPVSGEVTGGSAPGMGSQTTSIAFDKGAVVKIVKAWGQGGSNAASSTVSITC